MILIYRCEMFLTIKIIMLLLFQDKNSLSNLSEYLYYSKLKCKFITFIKSPTIYLVNYPCNVLEFLFFGLFPRNTRALTRVKSSITKIIGFVPVITLKGKDNNYEYTKQKVKETIDRGESIFVYADISTKRKKADGIGELHKGIFYISKELGVSITPLVIDRIKIDYKGCLQNKILDYKMGKTHVVKNVKLSMKYVYNLYSKFLDRKD